MASTVEPTSRIDPASRLLSYLSARVLRTPVEPHEVAFARTLAAWAIFGVGHFGLVAWDWICVHVLALPSQF